MGIDINAIKGRLNKLQNTQKKSDSLWKPTPGKTQVRIAPYKFNKDNPFIELYFHYNINNKTYLSPQSFGRPDPIVEFADKLKRPQNPKTPYICQFYYNKSYQKILEFHPF